MHATTCVYQQEPTSIPEQKGCILVAELEKENQQKPSLGGLTHSAIRVPDGISPPTAKRTERDMDTGQFLNQGACRGHESYPHRSLHR
jgi:hypothetical protein